MAVTGRLRNRIIRKRFLCLGWGKSAFLYLHLSTSLATHLSKTIIFIYSGSNFPPPLHVFCLSGLPALVVAVSVGFTKAKGYGTVN